MKKIIVLLLVAFVFSCKGGEATFPKSTDKARREKRGGGKVSDEGGITLFGGSDEEEELTKVDPVLWKAALDSVSFMPLASVDRKSGVIVTDWYEMKKADGERYKLNILIGNKLQVGGVKVSAFKQKLQAGNWRDAPVSKAFGESIEDKIFNNARKLKATK